MGSSMLLPTEVTHERKCGWTLYPRDVQHQWGYFSRRIPYTLLFCVVDCRADSCGSSWVGNPLDTKGLHRSGSSMLCFYSNMKNEGKSRNLLTEKVAFSKKKIKICCSHSICGFLRITLSLNYEFFMQGRQSSCFKSHHVEDIHERLPKKFQ